MRNRALKTTVSLVAGFLLLGTTAVGYSFAQEAPDTGLRAHMEQMMDQMPGGIVQDMGNAMGSDFDAMIDQCVALMGQMSQMMKGTPGTTDAGDAAGMMGGSAGSGMMREGEASQMMDSGRMRGMMRSMMMGR